MTSVDSGVDTGNESNDSAQAEIQAFDGFGRGKALAAIVKSMDSLNKSQKQIIKFDEVEKNDETLTNKMICHRVDNVNQTRNSISRFGCSAVRKTAVESFSQDETYRLMKKRASLEPYYKSHWSRRMRLAAATNNIELMTQMLERGVCPNDGDEQGRTALHLACSRGYSEMVKLLLDHGADPNQIDSIGNTPLHLAAITSKISVVTLLLKAGTNVLLYDRRGYNPLQLAQAKLRMLQNCKGSDTNRIKEENSQDC